MLSPGGGLSVLMLTSSFEIQIANVNWPIRHISHAASVMALILLHCALTDHFPHIFQAFLLLENAFCISHCSFCLNEM